MAHLEYEEFIASIYECSEFELQIKQALSNKTPATGNLFREHIPQEWIDRYNNSANYTEQDVIGDDFDIRVGKLLRYLPPFTIQPEFFTLYYTLSEGAKMSLKQQEAITLAVGDLIVISPHTIVNLDVGDAILLHVLIRKTTFLNVFLNNIPNQTVLSDFFKSTLFGDQSQGYVLFRTQREKTIQDLLFHMAYEYHAKHIYFEKMLNLQLSNLFLELLRNFANEVAVNFNFTPNIISSIMDYLEDHYNDVLIEDLSEKFGYHSSYLRKMFKASTGMTLQDALIRIKMEKASNLLTNSALTVDEISSQIGYGISSNFVRVFRKTFGMPPSQYRNLYGEHQRNAVLLNSN